LIVFFWGISRLIIIKSRDQRKRPTPLELLNSSFFDEGTAFSEDSVTIMDPSLKYMMSQGLLYDLDLKKQIDILIDSYFNRSIEFINTFSI
jgi:hypothetical protein